MNEFVIADPKKCIGCHTCMAACITQHRALGLQASPRLFLTHTRAGTMPIQCRHCDDAPCSRVCPVGSITVKDHAVLLNETVCTGCKMCVLACAIGAVAVDGTLPAGHPTHTGQFSYTPVSNWPGPLYHDSSKESVHPILDWNIGQKAVAIKCDLCRKSANGPECVRVCPTGALQLVSEQVVGKLTTDKRARAIVDVLSGKR